MVRNYTTNKAVLNNVFNHMKIFTILCLLNMSESHCGCLVQTYTHTHTNRKELKQYSLAESK